MKEEENNIKNKIFKDGQQKALLHVGLTSGWVWSEWHEGFDCACPAGQQLGGRYSAAFSPPACPAGSKAVLRLRYVACRCIYTVPVPSRVAELSSFGAAPATGIFSRNQLQRTLFKKNIVGKFLVPVIP